MSHYSYPRHGELLEGIHFRPHFCQFVIVGDDDKSAQEVDYLPFSSRTMQRSSNITNQRRLTAFSFFICTPASSSHSIPTLPSLLPHCRGITSFFPPHRHHLPSSVPPPVPQSWANCFSVSPARIVSASFSTQPRR